MTSTSNNTICYHAVQRIFRNAVVQLIRSKMSGAFGPQATSKLKAPFQKEWDEMVKAAEASRANGDVSATIIDDFDYLGVNHFFNLFEAYYKTLVPSTDEPSHPLPSRTTLLGYLKAIKDLRDPLSHPALEEFSFDDSHHLLNCARLVLGYLRLSAEAVEIQRLMRNLSDVPLARANRKKLLVAMPSEDSVYIDFIGRAPELVELSTWFQQPTNKRLLLVLLGHKILTPLKIAPGMVNL